MQFKDIEKPEGLICHDISSEKHRYYQWYYLDENNNRQEAKCVINQPIALFYKKDSTTHRIANDQGMVFCVPCPGRYGCVLSWEKYKKDKKLVDF